MKNKEYTSLNKMVQYIDKVLIYVKNINFDEFSDNEKCICNCICN